MEQEALLEQLNDLLDKFAEHQAFMAKATEQAGKFKPEVIEKVIADHQIKASLLSDDIEPLVPQLQSAIAEIDASISEHEDSKGNLGEALEEMQLRHAIGEIGDDEFEEMSRDSRATVEDADGRITELQGGREHLQAAVDRWSELSGIEITPPSIPEPPEPPPAPEIPAADVGEVEESVEVVEEAEVDFDFDEGEGEGDVDVAVAEGAEPVEVELDDGQEEASESSSEGVEVSGKFEPSADGGELAEGDEDSRRALLLYQEGTPEEQIYPFTGEVLTIGRGRDNDIQIKNDSKVSRFHCKLFRRGHNFYVEDNKSSNGTLINGELVTERRLFGGEEIIIGETYFRFRIM